MAIATSDRNDFRQRMARAMYENGNGFGWFALFLFFCLLVVFALGLWVASRSQCRVVLRNESDQSIHDVVLKPAAASSREPRHFLSHLSEGASETFVLYPLGPCSLLMEYKDAQGHSHHWEGARLSPRGGRSTVHVHAEDIIATVP